MMTAQYIAVLFAFNVKENLIHSLSEVKVHLIILSTGLVLAAGYIINNFYDVEKDLVNRPARTRFQNLVSRGFKLRLYVLLNVLAFSIAGYASLNILIFFAVFAFLLWFYSHKLSKIVLISELTASFLTVLGFFSLVLYYRMMNIEIFIFGASMFMVIFSRELFKDIVGYKGDVIYGYQSITTSIGIDMTRRLFQVIVILSMLIDAGFLAIQHKPEMFVVHALLLSLKVLMLYMIDRQIIWVKRLLQLVILIYVIGVAWL